MDRILLEETLLEDQPVAVWVEDSQAEDLEAHRAEDHQEVNNQVQGLVSTSHRRMDLTWLRCSRH